MSKKYDYRKVKSNRPLKIKDICRIFKKQKLHEKTIRTWIRKGELEAFKIDGIIYINGFVFKNFLKNRRSNNKPKLQLEDFKCWHCKYVGYPLYNIILRLTDGRNKSLAAYGECPECSKKMERLFKRQELQEILKIFSVKQNEVMGLYDSSSSTRNAHIERVEKKPINEPKKYKPPDAKSKTRSSTKKAHINENQLTLF